ncbi:MAG: YitT family protein [Prevotella sp.]|nr:YitT family protein [Prevotella sp.]
MNDKLKRLSDTLAFKETVDYLYLTVGLVLYAFGWVFFLLPYQLMSGGLTGLSALVFYATGFKVAYTYFLVNVALLIVALKILGWRFLARTIYGIFMLSFFVGLFQELITQSDGTLFQLLGPGETFMSIVLGGMICGSSLAIIFLNNGSTGGTDIVGMVVNKYREISIGRVLILLDVFIIGSSYFILDDWRKVVLGYVFVILENWMLDYVMNANRASVQFLIFSTHYKDIAHEIGTRVGRGITLMDAHGWYSGKEMKVLCILAKKQESVLILRIIKNIDPNAFVSIGAVSGVYGEGFDKIKMKPANPEQMKLEMKTNAGATPAGK